MYMYKYVYLSLSLSLSLSMYIYIYIYIILIANLETLQAGCYAADGHLLLVRTNPHIIRKRPWRPWKRQEVTHI